MSKTPLPLAFAFTSQLGRCAKLSVIATDVDGTLTTDGVIDAVVIDAIARLGLAGFEVMPVSGRPAGEVLGLCRYLPGVRRGIAENGLLEVVPDRAPAWVYGRPTDLERLLGVGSLLNAEHEAKLRRTGDAFCRMGDVAYERDDRGEVELSRLRDLASAHGVFLVWSNVHVHLAERMPDKGEALLKLLRRDRIDPASVVTIGDAPNDEGLFRSGRFGLTVGTADVLDQLSHFDHAPEFVANAREAAAFLELAEQLLALRGA